MSLKRFLVVSAMVCFILLTAGQSSATLMIAPLRVVFEDRARSATIALLNTGNKTRTFRIGWKLMKMDEDGKYHDIPLDDTDPFTVPKMVVFSPRQVTIEPNGRQNIRLSLRRPANLPAGEYRGHLTLIALPDDESRGSLEAPRRGMEIMLNVELGFSVPVIVRVGPRDGAEVKIESPALSLADAATGAQQVDAVLTHKEGSQSSYGRVRAFNQQGEQIGMIDNIALYPEQSKRNIHIILQQKAQPGSHIQLVYEGTSEYIGETFAKKDIVVGN